MLKIKTRRLSRETWAILPILCMLTLSALSPATGTTLTTARIAFEAYINVPVIRQFYGTMKLTFWARAFETESQLTLPFDNLTIHIFNGSVPRLPLETLQNEEEEVFTTCIPYEEYMSEGYLPDNEFRDKYREKPYYDFKWNTCRYPNGEYTFFLFVWLGNDYDLRNLHIWVLNDDLSQLLGYYIPPEVQFVGLILGILGIGVLILRIYNKKN